MCGSNYFGCTAVLLLISGSFLNEMHKILVFASVDVHILFFVQYLSVMLCNKNGINDADNKLEIVSVNGN